jgi:hypothetical protein
LSRISGKLVAATTITPSLACRQHSGSSSIQADKKEVWASPQRRGVGGSNHNHALAGLWQADDRSAAMQQACEQLCSICTQARICGWSRLVAATTIATSLACSTQAKSDEVL